ncbi:MAG TPA: DJ-1/PfpI family protein [Actinocrinis sp.]|jgi:putative intracellular protease/amidase
MRIIFAVFPRLTALDAIGPYQVMEMLPGAEVAFAARTLDPVVDSAGWLTLVPAVTFDAVESADVLVVPGGPGARSSVGDEELLDWIRRIHGTTAWTTSVCTGSLLLGAAGLLRGLDATTHWSAVEPLEGYGARYTAERVVRQGRIVTAAGVSAGIDMALTLADIVAGRAVAEALQLMIEYDPQPPFDSGSVAKASPEARAYWADRLPAPAAVSQ